MAILGRRQSWLYLGTSPSFNANTHLWPQLRNVEKRPRSEMLDPSFSW